MTDKSNPLLSINEITSILGITRQSCSQWRGKGRNGQVLKMNRVKRSDTGRSFVAACTLNELERFLRDSFAGKHLNSLNNFKKSL